MVRGGHGVVHQAGVVAGRVRQGVVQGEVPQQGLYQLFGLAVGFQVLHRGLVGDVEHHLAGKALLPQKACQGRQQLPQKVRVFRGGGGGVPAKGPAALALFRHIDGRGRLGPPLGEQVGDFKILHAAAVGHADKPLHQGEVKAVRLSLLLHAQQLDAGSLGADFRIQRRGEKGREHHVHALLPGGGKELLPQGPVLLGPHRHMVVIGQAVPVEPLGVHQLLGRQIHPHHVEGERGFRLPRLAGKAQGDGVVPPGAALGHLAVYPQHRGQKGADLHRGALQGQQGVGEQPRLGGEVALIVAGGIGRHGAGHLAHLEHLHPAQGGGRLHLHRGDVPAVPLEHHLKGELLAPQAAGFCVGLGLHRPAQQEFFQRGI